MPHGGDEPPEVMVLGVHVKSDGYPNVVWRLKGMENALGVRLKEINYPFRGVPGERRRPFSIKPFRLLKGAWQIVYAHFCVLIRYFLARRARYMYIPYPAVFLLFFFSLLPRRARPKVLIADAFISLYDTVVEDRGFVRPGSLFARLLGVVESRAYRTADRVLVDTECNAAYFRNTFGLDAQRVKPLPLAIDERTYGYAPYVARRGPCKVLFIGTFVPLQGVETIARAARILKGRTDIEIKLIGSGQTAPQVQQILGDIPPKNLTWIREWLPSGQLAEEIRGADVCLGIFGVGEKTQRVWPIKNYVYMSVGRPVLTGDTVWARELAALVPQSTFMTVPVGNPEALAAEISRLANDPDLRVALANRTRDFYRRYLSSKVSVEYILEQFSAL